MKFMKLGSRPDTFYTTEAVRAVSSEVSSDLIVQVKGIRYLLHKFHLLSKCLLLQRLCSEIPESKHHQIVQLPDFPGGIEAFELCAKFCYGITITLSAHNIVSARCAAEYLQMTDEAEKGNLIYKIEVFFNSCVLNGWKDSIVTLQSTKSLPSWSEDLGITSRCIDAIASKVLANPSRVNLSNSSSRRGRDDISWCNGSESRRHDKPVSKGWWAEDIAELSIDLYWRAMIAIKSVRKPPSSLIGEALRIYVSQWLANISKDSNNANRMESDSDLVGKMNAKHRLVLETITSLLPPEKGALSCSFLLKLLKVANILNASNCSKMELVRRVGIQLEEAKVSDLFIRSVTNDMVYDVDMVLSILEQFMLQGQSPPTSPPTVKDGLERRRRSGSAEKSEFQESSRSSSASHSSIIKVAKLVDGYVQQVAHDRNLPMSEFIAVAEAVPEFARLDHDGLYRAIDIYLKAHPNLNKSDRKRLCRVLDCKKLSMEACTHVAQNERLPLRVVVQVLTIKTDASMLTSSCQPIALPDGGEIVDLDSPEQKPLVDFDATINKAYQSSVLVSNSEKENTRETSKRQCMTESVLSSDDSRTRISLTDLVAPDYRADLVRAYQNGPIMFTLDNKNTREGLNGELLPERTSLAIFSKNTIHDFYDDDTGDSEGSDHCTAMLPNVKDEFVDGLSSSCGNECIILSTTNHRDRHDAALLPLVNMDTYIHTASPQPIALPDGGENVLLQSIQQKSLVDFDATNNRDQSSDLVSNSKKKYTRVVSKKRCRTQSLLSLVESTTRISSTDFDSPENREHLNNPIVFNSEKKDTREALKGECLNKNALSLHNSTKQNSCPDFDATINKAHLVEAYLSNENRGDASKRECIGKSILGLEDLRQHFGGRRDDAAKGFGDSLAWTSFEVLETLAPWEQPNGCAPLLSLGRSTLGGRVQQEKSPDLPRIMRIDTVGQRVTKSPRYLEGLTAQSASCSHCPIGLPDRENALLLDPLEQSTKNAAHAAQADLCSPTVSLPKKKMMRKSLKTKCPTMSLVFEDNREHFGRRWEGPAKSLRVTPICMKHGINQVSLVNRIHKPHGIHWLPFRQKWERRKGFSLEGERTFEVSSLSMDDILDSRLLFIHMPQFARSSPQTLASPDGGTIVRPIALLSSSELAATNNRALHFRRDHSGSITSHYERRNTSETSNRQGIAMSLCSVKDLQHHLGFKHKDTVKRLGVSVPRFKRTYRQHRIYWQPYWIRSNERKAFDATNNRAHLVEADQGGPIVSNLEKETTKEASKRKCITKSVPITEELRQHYGGRQRDAANGLCDSLSRKSLEVLDVLALWEESNSIEHVVPRRRLARQQHWIRPKKSLDLPRTLQMNCPGGLTAQSASSLHWPIGLPVGGHIVFLSKKIRKTFKRECRTISVSFEGHQQHFGSRREGVASSPSGNHICEQHGISLVPKVKRICRQHGILRSPFRQGNSLGGERPAEVIGVCTEEKLVSRLQFLHMSLLGRSSLCLLALPSGSDCVGHIGFSSSEFTPTNNREHPGRQDWCGSSASRLETERTRETFYREGIASHVFSFEYHQQQFGRKRDNDAKILGVRVSTFKHISRHHGIHRWPNWIKNSVWRCPDPIGEKNPSPTFKKLATNRQITMENDMSGQKHEPNEFLPDSFEDLNFWKKENGSIGEIEKAPTFHDSFSNNCCDADICFSSVYNKTEAEGGSFQWAFRPEGLTTQSTVYPYLPTPVFPQPQIPSTEVLSENMGSFEDRRKLLASQAEDFLEGHVSESSNLTFPACSDAAAPSQLVATILHTVHAISHMIPPLTGGFSETFPLEGQSIQSTAYQNHNALEFPQSQIALTQIPIENMGSSEDWRASQQEPFLEGHVSGSVNSTVPTCSGPSPSQQPMPGTPYTMHKIPHMMPPLTYSQDASSVKVKAEYRDTIIEFQLPHASGIIDLKEEVAMILKLDLDSFDVKYKDEEGKGDWILMLCDKDLMNYLQLFSSLVNPVIRLLVVDKDSNLTNLDPMALKQPAMFVVSGIDSDNNGIISDLLRFVSKKEIYKKAGKAWTRFYLLYEPPGADRSSLIAAMANYLEFDICDLDLRSMFSIPELKNMLLSTPNRSLIAIQDIDHCDVMLPNLKNELTVSCLLKYVHGLFSRCGDEQIIVFTTNHRDRNDAALLPLVNMDIYIPASSPQPIALPDGGEIVQLESSKQKPLVDFDATNNRECGSVVLVSRSKNNNKREASKRLCMTESVLSVVNPTTGISLTGFDAPNNRAHLVRACQGGPIMSNSEKKDTGEGLKGDFLSRSVLSLDDSTKQKSLLDCDATENKAHLLIAYQSGPVVSLLENRNRGQAMERECITKSILGLEDLQQHSGGRRDNAAKSFTAIYDPGIHTTNSLARNSFEVVETLRPWEQPSNATDTEREREIWAQMCLEQSDACGAHSIHVNTYAGRFRAHLFLSLCHSVCIRSIFWELPNDFVPLLSLRRLTLKGCVRKEKSTYLPRLLQIIAVEPGPTKSPRYSGGSFAKSGTPLHWSDGLPNGGQVVSPSEKEIVRKTLKRKCRTTKVRRLEYHQLHFESRCQDAAKRHGAKRICRQHMINQVSTVKCIHGQHGIQWWPFRQKWAMMKVYSLEGQRPLEVISLSKGWKFVVRLQVIHVSWLGRSSPGSSAIPGGGREIVGLIALSSSGFAATDNRANLVGQNPSGSTASHSNKKKQRDAAVGKRINSNISEQDLRRHFGLTREEAAKRLGVSVTTLKRRCRHYGIMRWPCNRNGSSDIPGRPPDPNEDFFAELRDLLEIPTNEASGSYEAAIEQQEQITLSFAYRTHNGPVRAQPHMASEEMASENTRSSDLTSQVEAILEGHGSGSNYLTLPTFSNPASSQPVSTISETGPTVSQHISTIPGIVPSQVEARSQAHGSGSSYLTVPTSSNPASTQPMSTIPETGPTIPQPGSTIPVTGPTIPHIMPPLIAQQDMRLVTIKAKYSDSIVSFKLPLTSGLTELNEKLAMRLKLRLDSFDVEYRDEEGLWILISCDEDLRDYLQLFSSLDNQVIKLSVLDKVVNANESSGSFKRKRPWEA